VNAQPDVEAWEERASGSAGAIEMSQGREHALGVLVSGHALPPNDRQSVPGSPGGREGGGCDETVAVQSPPGVAAQASSSQVLGGTTAPIADRRRSKQQQHEAGGRGVDVLVAEEVEECAAPAPLAWPQGAPHWVN
jgi:hypothetical protein